MKEFRGNLVAQNKHLAVVISHFYPSISEHLLTGVKKAIKEYGGNEESVDVFWVKGCFEIPWVLQKLARSKHYDGLIALGAIIRGKTLHFDLIAREVTHGIVKISLSEDIPITHGIIAANTLEEALERSGGTLGNRGYEAACSLLESLNLKFPSR